MDAAVKDGIPFIGIGAVIRNSTGDVATALSKPVEGIISAEVCEFLAVREGLLLAKQMWGGV